MSWTDDRIAKLEKLWLEGKSAAEIAEELGGVTRNAVIGKAHRMGLSGRPSPIKKKKAAESKSKKATAKKKEAAPKKKAEPKTRKKAASSKKEPDKELLTVLDLTDKICKWPIGDPRDDDFHFCGDFSPPGQPYCDEHIAMAYQSSSKNKAKQAEEEDEDEDDIDDTDDDDTVLDTDDDDDDEAVSA